MWFQSAVLYPYCMRRVCWDLLTLLLVSYEAIAIPLEFLDPPRHPITDVMKWVTRLFWTADVVMTAFTGFVMKDGTIEMRPRQIWWNYTQDRLWFDMACVAPDWIELFWSTMAGGALTRFQRAARAFRLVRCLRIVRLFRLRKVLQFLIEQIQSDIVIFAMDISKVIAGLAIVAHLLACFWYAVGKVSSAQGWPEIYLYDEQALQHRYLISLHWAVCQFSSGSFAEIYPGPQNEWERLYAVIVALFALAVAAAFIGHITSYMTNFFIQEFGDTRRVALLRKYLRQTKVSKILVSRLQRSATYALRQRRTRIAEEDVELLRFVSSPLQMELHFEMYVPMLSVYPFFARSSVNCPQLMRKVCHTAVSMTLMHCGDIIFSDGAVAVKMYIVLGGRSQYTTRAGTVIDTHVGLCISEAALWTSWEHHGDLMALGDGKLCEIDARSFQDVVASFRSSDGGLSEYAAEFCQDLNSRDRELSDLISCCNVAHPSTFKSRGVSRMRANRSMKRTTVMSHSPLKISKSNASLELRAAKSSVSSLPR